MANSFYFIRHGQSEANAGNTPAGTLDSPLTAKGRDEARAVRDHVMALSQRPTRIFTSNLSRAKDTAAIINEALRLPVEEVRELHEQFYGDCQGLDKDSLAKLHGPDWSHSPPNGESFADFGARVRRALEHVFTRMDSGTPLIVGHGGMIHALGGVYNNALRGAGNCAFLYFEGTHGAWRAYDCTNVEAPGTFRPFRALNSTCE